MDVYEVTSATATADFINARVTSGIGYWLANAGILLVWDNSIQVIPDCATTPCSPTDAQDLAQITNPDGLTALLQRFPDRTSGIIVLFNQSLGFGVNGITPYISPDFANVTVLSSATDDVLPHELGHVFDLFHTQNPFNLMCGPVSYLDFLPSLYCSTLYSKGITPEQIQTARANATRFKPSGGL